MKVARAGLKKSLEEQVDIQQTTKFGFPPSSNDSIRHVPIEAGNRCGRRVKCFLKAASGLV